VRRRGRDKERLKKRQGRVADVGFLRPRRGKCKQLTKIPLGLVLRSSSCQIEMQLYYLKKVLLLTSVDIIRTVAMPLPSVRLTPGFPERSATKLPDSRRVLGSVAIYTQRVSHLIS
jgi:hypothetical protein